MIVIIVILISLIIFQKKDPMWKWKMNKPYWRVTYKDGRQTRLLYYKEAKSLAETFDGKYWYDIESEKKKEL